MSKTDCPTDQALRDYILGNCSDAASEEIEGHLTQCTTCEATISQFDSADDTLVRHLPLAAAATEGAAAPRPGWIDVLRGRPPSSGSGQVQNGQSEQAAPATGPDWTSKLPDGCANYELLGVLGRGGMGVVFLARHRQLNRRVALKVVRPDALSNGQARRRFQREIQILGGLNHAGIVMATDAGTVGAGAYLVMELIDGADLGRIVREGGPLTIEAACEAGRQTSEALAAAHGGGVVHRDVKPSNIMLDCHGRVRLLDFGLAHVTLTTQNSGETSVERLLGTLDFMAPEQTEPQRPVDARADLYGLGATLYFLLTGRPPHGSRSGRSILEHIRVVSHDDASPVSSIRVDVPAELDALVSQLLRRDPESRPQSAAEVAVALARWSGGNLADRVAEFKLRQQMVEPEAGAAARQSFDELLETGGASQLPVALPSAARPRRRSRLGISIALATLAGIILAGVTIWQKTPQGTLKIESEVGDVVVEALDERDRIRELRISKGTNEIVLSAGQYRVRLAGTHDGVDLDHDVITLRRGDETIVRITRLADRVAANQEQAGLPAAKDAAPVPTERLYQGKPESEWKRLIAAETEPISKLEAASALLALAGELPPRARLEQILDVGEEIVRASFGDASLEFALEDLRNIPNRAQRWDFSRAERMNNAYCQFARLAADMVASLPDEVWAELLTQAVLKGNESRAAFAAALLRVNAPPKVAAVPAAVEVVLKSLDVPLTGIDRSAICLLLRLGLLRWGFITEAQGEQRASILTAVHGLAVRLVDSPQGGLRDQVRDVLLYEIRRMPEKDSSPRFRQTVARVILDEMIENPGPVLRPFTENPRSGWPKAYSAETIAKTRKQFRYFLDAWVGVANDYLQVHLNDPAERGVQRVLQSLQVVLRLYSEGDDWPVDQTGVLLTELLRNFYAGAPGNLTDQSTDESFPSSPAALLTQIVQMTGQIPGFVHGGQLRSPAVAKKLVKFKICLERQTDSPLFQRQYDFAIGLLDEAPYEAIKLCVGENELGENVRHPALGIIVHGVNVLATPTELLYAVSSYNDDRNNRRELPADPLLVLAVAVDLTGQSEAQDARISTLFTEGAGAKMFRANLEDLLSGSLKAGAIARQLLQKMAAGAKSEKLTNVVRSLLPAVAKEM